MASQWHDLTALGGRGGAGILATPLDGTQPHQPACSASSAHSDSPPGSRGAGGPGSGGRQQSDCDLLMPWLLVGEQTARESAASCRLSQFSCLSSLCLMMMLRLKPWQLCKKRMGGMQLSGMMQRSRLPGLDEELLFLPAAITAGSSRDREPRLTRGWREREAQMLGWLCTAEISCSCGARPFRAAGKPATGPASWSTAINGERCGACGGFATIRT